MELSCCSFGQTYNAVALSVRSRLPHINFIRPCTAEQQVIAVALQDLDTGKVLTRQYGSVINACGHHWDPLWPELKGIFKGSLLHAHSYRSPKPYEGMRVCIIGGGNSGGLPQHTHNALAWHQLALGIL